MLRVNKKNCYITQKISIKLKQYKDTQSIKLSWLSKTG